VPKAMQVIEGEEPNPSSGSDPEAAAARAEARLREAIEVLPQGIVFLDADGRYIMWNQRYAEIYSRSADLLRPGARLADTLRIGIARGDYPESAGREEEWLTERLALLDNPGTRHEQRLSNGRCIMIEERKTEDGGTIGLRVDITDLKDREQSFRLLFESNPVPLLVYDPGTAQVRSANEAACAHFGYTKDEIEGLPAQLLFADDEWQEAQGLLASNGSNKDRFWRQRSRDGQGLESVLFTRRSSIAGEDSTIISVFDVTERRQAEAQMAHMARHDELTGLANRAQCREQLHIFLSGPNPTAMTVALIDLDHFKAVNDTYGHLVGDALLAEAARRMRAQIPKRALLCRMGGDEFAVVFGKASSDQVELVAKSIIATLSQPFFIADNVLHIGATIGSASAPIDAHEAGTLLRYADLALYEAKRGQRGSYRRFELAMDEAAQKRSRLETDFREAVSRGQLTVAYQPLVNLADGEVQAYEALLRWTHPEWGEIAPDTFIPLAEELGLIDQIGQFVLRTACREAAGWAPHIKVSVNVSPVQFRSGNLLNIVLQALSYAGLAPERLELEITEAVLIDRGEEASSTIESLRTLGVGLAMDDFGTGYSSLRYLLSYPFTKIKIDKSFVLSLKNEGNSEAVIKAVIGLGNSLGLTVTAEGIETEATWEYLREVGCLQGQGYYFGEARPANELDMPVERRGAA
jgi:diguanylate cyclase (GGDEF)-like protein/PAS domain S-box-containing protein